MIGTEIENKVRKDLIDFIKFEIKNLCQLLNTDNFFEVLDFNNMLEITFQVEVDNSYLDIEDTCYENRRIVGYGINENDNPYILDEYSMDYTCECLNFEELVHIANTLELTYLKEIRKNNE